MLEIFGSFSPDLKFADLHMHTNRSDGHAHPWQIVEMAVRSGILNTLAITDHDSINPALEAKEYCLQQGYPLEIIIGAEITTQHGHLLGLFLEENIPANQSIRWTIRQIHAQGGLAIAAHPMYSRIRSLKEAIIKDVVADNDPEVYFDGFEIYNAGVEDSSRSNANQTAQLFYTKNPYLGAAIGSSDGHFFSASRGLTGYRGDLYQSIKDQHTQVFALDADEQLQLFRLASTMFGPFVSRPNRKIRSSILSNKS